MDQPEPAKVRIFKLGANAPEVLQFLYEAFTFETVEDLSCKTVAVVVGVAITLQAAPNVKVVASRTPSGTIIAKLADSEVYVRIAISKGRLSVERYLNAHESRDPAQYANPLAIIGFVLATASERSTMFRLFDLYEEAIGVASRALDTARESAQESHAECAAHAALAEVQKQLLPVRRVIVDSKKGPLTRLGPQVAPAIIVGPCNLPATIRSLVPLPASTLAPSPASATANTPAPPHAKTPAPPPPHAKTPAPPHAKTPAPSPPPPHAKTPSLPKAKAPVTAPVTAPASSATLQAKTPAPPGPLSSPPGKPPPSANAQLSSRPAELATYVAKRARVEPSDDSRSPLGDQRPLADLLWDSNVAKYREFIAVNRRHPNTLGSVEERSLRRWMNLETALVHCGYGDPTRSATLRELQEWKDH